MIGLSKLMPSESTFAVESTYYKITWAETTLHAVHTVYQHMMSIQCTCTSTWVMVTTTCLAGIRFSNQTKASLSQVPIWILKAIFPEIFKWMLPPWCGFWQVFSDTQKTSKRQQSSLYLLSNKSKKNWLGTFEQFLKMAKKTFTGLGLEYHTSQNSQLVFAGMGVPVRV